MSKTLWIIHQYASTPETGMGGRHFYLAEELTKLGYKVYLIAANNHHLLRNSPNIKERYYFDNSRGFTFVWIDMPSYAEAHSKQRVFNWFLFPLRLQKLAKLIPDKPDAIISSSPSPFAFLGAERLAKKFKAKLFFEVRDIWPLTLIELGGYSPKHPFIRLMQWVENRAYQKSDGVISNLKNSVEHMQSRGMDPKKFYWIPNGFSLNEVNQEVPLNEDANSKLPKDKFIIGYTGTMGVANALDTLIEAAEIVQDKPDIAFVLVGQGKERAALEQMVKDKKLSNIYFIDPIPKIEIQAMLAKFDACYIGWLNDDLYRFGIGANKIPEYLYSGKPILHGFSGKGDPIQEYNAGLTFEAENPQALSDAIINLYQMPKEEREAMGSNGRKAALDEYEYGMLASKLAKLLN